MGFRLLVDKRKGAALNLLSETLNSFDTESAGRAAVLASFASVAVNAIAHGEDAASLRRGLLSNREIGKAVGMLMLLNGFTEEEAFDLLRHHSQSLNIKLADVARTVIENRGQLPPPPPPRLELVAAVHHRGEHYRFDTDALDSYLTPKTPTAADPDAIRRKGRGIAYTRTAFAYLFRLA